MEPFQRLKVIGKGSYGEVWLALHTVDKKQYVLKKMELRNASRRERKAAEQEAKLLSKLKHPNIVAYKDSFETDDGLLWIAMGYCEGGDLYTYLKGRKGALLDERQIVEWFVQISMALQYLHERNVLHRDLKTQNIFLTRSRIIKVGDLGIARVLDSENDMATTLIGTPYYMSPELFANKPYNHKSDVWALGCCVHEMASLRHAFNAKDMNSLVYKILRGRAPPMPEQYSSDLANLVKAMLNQNPARRPSVAKILRDPYIRRNIAIFLEGTKNRSKRPASSSAGSDQAQPPGRSAVGGSSSSAGGRKALSPAEELPVRGAPRDLDTITEMSVSEVERTSSSQNQRQPQRGSSSSGGDSGSSRRGSAGSSRAVSDALPRSREDAPAAAAAALRNGAAVPAARPRQTADAAAASRAMPQPAADRGRALHTVSSAPSIASRQRGSDSTKQVAAPPTRRSADQPEEDSSIEPLSARSGSEPSLSSTNPNLQARARRREKKSQATEPTHPSAVAAPAAVDRHHDARLTRQQHSASSASANAERGSEQQQEHRRGARTAAVEEDNDDDGGGGDNLGVGEEETATESAEGGGGVGDGPQAAAADKDMVKLTTLLDATLNMQPDIEDEEDDAGAGDDDRDEPTLVPSPSQPSRLAAGRAPAAEAAEPAGVARPTPAARAALPSFGKETLGSTTRLNDRIAALHRDCVRGVGFERLHKAYQILNGFEDDEVESRLRELLVGDLFDEYAGKIWQLKFCEESAFRP